MDSKSVNLFSKLLYYVSQSLPFSSFIWIPLKCYSNLVHNKTREYIDYTGVGSIFSMKDTEMFHSFRFDFFDILL